jgi:three-Cys-motif partner protein
MMATDTSFFDESSEQSRVKSAIVAKYFDAWAIVIIGAQDRHRQNKDNRIAYIDLFAGPGRYSDGTKSTPLLILEKAIQHDTMRERLVTIFNDRDESNTNSLQEAISSLPGIDTLTHKPQIDAHEVGDNIVKMFEQMNLVPTLFFVDPWGYKGLSLRLVNSVLKDWGCDCIFFFNYNRINMGLTNNAVREHMDALFGQERADDLRQQLEPLPPVERELLIVEELCKALRELGPRFVLPFRFKDNHGTRTSHHLIFVSKGFKGYEIMKETMAKECSGSAQGVPSFEYNPVDARLASRQPLLFELARPLDDLGDMLLEAFSGQTTTMYRIYEQHNVDRPYIKKNYKTVLMKLEDEGRITASSHRKGTFGDTVQATFPVFVKAEAANGS